MPEWRYARHSTLTIRAPLSKAASSYALRCAEGFRLFFVKAPDQRPHTPSENGSACCRSRIGRFSLRTNVTGTTVVNHGQSAWRRRRDSNPRYGLSPYNGLANRRLQPLGHVSERACLPGFAAPCKSSSALCRDDGRSTLHDPMELLHRCRGCMTIISFADS